MGFLGSLGKPNVQRLAETGDIEGLVRALGHRDEHVRRDAAEALGNTSGPLAVAPLLGALDDAARSVQGAAAESLGKLRNPAALSALALRTIRTDLPWNERFGFRAFALGLKPFGAEAVPALLRAFETRSRENHPLDSAVDRLNDGLATLGREAAVVGLLTCCGEPDPVIRAHAIARLAWFSEEPPDEESSWGDPYGAYRRTRQGARSWRLCLRRHHAGDHLLPLVSGADEDLRFLVAELLVRSRDRRALDGLIALLSSKRFAGGAADLLGELGDSSAVEPLLATLRADLSTLHPTHYVRALAALGDVRAVGPIIDILLRDGDEWAAAEAASALGKLGDARATAPLTAIVAMTEERFIERWIASREAFTQYQSSNAPEDFVTFDDVRRAAGWSLEKLAGHATAVAAEIEGQQQTNRDAEQVKAGLKARAHESAVNALIDAGQQELDLDSPKPLVDKVAAIGPRAVDLLQPALTDESRLVRKDAARVLGAIGGPAAVASLAGLLSDEDPDVTRAAAKALRRIGGPQAQRLLAARARR